MLTILAGFSIRQDLFGVTSFIRCLHLEPLSYYLMLHVFHSKALLPSVLLHSWVHLCVKLFDSSLYLLKGKMVILVDGLKNPKEGRKMPGVKSLHQES